jgi:hypothetical protein
MVGWTVPASHACTGNFLEVLWRANDGRKLDHQTLETLRIRAVRQIEDGAHPEKVAAALGLRRSTVYGWVAKYREGGRRIYTLIVGADPRSCPSASRCRPGRWSAS